MLLRNRYGKVLAAGVIRLDLVSNNVDPRWTATPLNQAALSSSERAILATFSLKLIQRFTTLELTFSFTLPLPLSPPLLFPISTPPDLQTQKQALSFLPRWNLSLESSSTAPKARPSRSPPTSAPHPSSPACSPCWPLWSSTSSSSPRPPHCDPRAARYRPIFSRLPFFGSIDFYQDRTGFLRKHFGNPETKSFHGGARRITIRNEPVVLLAGDKADAKTFFYSRTLKFSQAYQRLLSGVPTEITAAAVLDQDKADVMFRENLKQAIRGERLAQLAPAMCEDTLRAVRAVPDWSKGKGVMDPKAFTFPLLFCMSMRTVGFADLADQPKIMKELADYYWAMERASSYWSTFFTKYPFRSSRIKEESGLFAALGAAAYRRQQEGVVGDDSVAMLMEKGLGADYAVRFVVSSLFAAIINSTSMSLWLLLYLGANPEIRKRAHKEVVDYLDGMAATQGSDWKSKPRVEQLQVLSLNEWEHGFPTIETCLKETMRTILKITLFRLNMGDKKGGTAAPKVHGEEVRTGEFLGYWMGSTHFDSKIYSNPHRWDPERWARGEGSGDMDFLGWGAGMHPCTGMRFAKLEIKNFCTTILALMDWETIEPRTGKVHTLDTLPEPEYNCNDRSPAVPVSIRFTAY